MGVFEELKARGFCFQGTDEAELKKLEEWLVYHDIWSKVSGWVC